MNLGVILLTSFVLVTTFASSQAVVRSCDYYQNLELGKTYYVYNPEYPNRYRGIQDCVWVGQTDYGNNIALTCTEMDIPSSDGCSRNYLSVATSNTTMYQYCGTTTFSVKSEGPTIRINLRASFASTGKFLCRMYVVPEIKYSPNCECGRRNPSRIVGGMDAGVNEFPMMAGLVNVISRDLYCGATIISDTHVLTVAHCVLNRDPAILAVVVGEHDVTTGSDTNATRLHKVKSLTVHPDYIPQKTYNDIAIVTLQSTIEFNMQVGPACLPVQHRHDSFAGSNVQILGWGNLEYTGERATVLQKVSVAVITNAQCSSYYDDIAPTKICTQEPEKDACQHDSGGPLLWTNPNTDRAVLVGMVSTGDGCAFGPPGVGTRVGAYIDWITAMTPYTNYCGRE